MKTRNTSIALGFHAALTILFGFVGLASATDIVWTNTAGGNWNTAANWSPNQVPSAADHTAIITNSGTYSVTNNGSRTLGGLVLGGSSGTQTLAQINAFTITLNGPGSIGGNGRFNLSSGYLKGTCVVTVDGQVNWIATGIGDDTNTVLVITPSGRLNLTGAASKSFDGAITNAGTIAWTDGGQFNQYGIVHNQTNGLIDMQANATMNASGATLLVNEGVLRKSGGTGTTTIEPELVNRGTLEAQVGTISFAGQSKTFSSGSRFTGAGTNLLVTLTAGQTLRMDGVIQSENLLLAGATLTGNATLDGSMAWSSGTLDTSASLTLLPGSALQLFSSNTKSLRGALTNAGQVVWLDAGQIDFYGRVHNTGTGVFEARNDSYLDWISGSPVFINDGVFRKTSSTGISYVQVSFVNNGTVDTQTGTIQFVQEAKAFNDGCQFTGAGAVTLPSGTITLNGSVTSANLVLEGAVLAGHGTLSGSLAWTSGSIAAGASLTVASNGLVQMNGNADKVVSGALTNAGQVVWAGLGNVNLYGVIHNAAGGVFEARTDEYLDWLSGTPAFINDGTFRKAQSTGSTYVQVAFINNGTVDAQTGTIQFVQESKTLNAGCRFTGAGKATLTTGSVALNGTIESENLVLAGATLNGAGSVNGSFTWNSGTLSPDVSFNVTPTGHLTLASSSAKVLNGTITNAGVVTWTGNGNLQVRGAIHNLPGGLFEIQNNEALDWVSGSPVFVNDGIVRKTVGTGITSCQIAFVNSGTVDVQAGTLQLLQEPKTLNAGCRFTGAGKTMLPAGTVTLNGAIDSENLSLDGASLTGSGSVNGSFTWNSGTLTPDISFNVTTNGLLLLASSGNKDLNGTITNAGTVRWTGAGNLRVRGAIHNLPSGLFDAQNNEYLDWISGTPVIVNEGTFRKSAGTATTTCQIPLFNRGRFEVNTGTFHQTAAFTNQAGIIALSGGTLQTAQPLPLSGGQLTGAGTLRPGFGAAAALINAGTVAPATNGVLTIQGDYTQLLPGAINFTLGGTAPGTNHSRLNITGDATLAGTVGVNLADGYLPNPGDTFNVMAFKNRASDFACYNGFLLLGHNRRLLTPSSTTNLSLVTVTMPDPTNPPVHVTVDYPSAIVCWPAEFVGYGLACTTNLSSPIWMPLPGVTNRYLETPTVPEKYFRLWQP